MPPGERCAAESISGSDGQEKEVALALIDSTRHSVYMTATAVLNSLARRGRSRTARAPQISRGAVISIRLAGHEEEAAIERLAQLAERPVPTGRALVAEVDGEVATDHPVDKVVALVAQLEGLEEIERGPDLHHWILGERHPDRVADALVEQHAHPGGRADRAGHEGP